MMAKKQMRATKKLEITRQVEAKKEYVRFAKFLSKMYIHFLAQRGLDEGFLHLNLVVLLDASRRYCRDLQRIRDGHIDIEIEDHAKRAGFITYWINKLKPISWSEKVDELDNLWTEKIDELDNEVKRSYRYVNEIFAIYIACGAVTSRSADAEKKLNLISHVGEYFDQLFHYNLRYRTTTGYSLSLVYYVLQYSLELRLDNDSLEKTMLMRMARLTEARDEKTGKHLERTAEYIRVFLSKLNEIPLYHNQLVEFKPEHVALAAMVHDIGKVAIKDSILNKKEKLSSEEYEIMKTHTTEGLKLIQGEENSVLQKSFLKPAYIIAEMHHERWDGKGYPNGFSGEAIPLLGRIMAIVDVYDALASVRPYKEAWTHEQVVNEIKRNSGTQFDPSLVEVFLQVSNDFENIYKVN